MERAFLHSGENLNQETWRPVVGYEGLYEVSDLGRVRRDAPSQATRSGRIKSQVVDKAGYRQVGLSSGNRKTRLKRVHRLVADAFGLGLKDGLEVNHINGIKDDNRLANLEVVTRSENMKHAYQALGIRPNVPGVLCVRDEKGRFLKNA